MVSKIAELQEMLGIDVTEEVSEQEPEPAPV